MIKGKDITIIKKQENTYIINLDGSYLYMAMEHSEEKQYITKNIDKVKLYTATIPYSLEMLRLDDYYKREIIHRDDKKQYTKAIINVNFNKDYSIWEDAVDEDTGNTYRKKVLVSNKKEIRHYLYCNGFVLDGVKYVFYKRGASKARTGSALFIKEKFYKKLINRSRLNQNGNGLKIEEGEQCDITSLNAYQSLILSGLEDIVDIPVNSILLINDIDSEPFKTVSSVTYQRKGQLITETKEVERVNNMTDGEGLLDESIFEKAGRSHKGMMLLRSDFFKCCCLNTKIQEFFKTRGYTPDDTIKDMFGREIRVGDIKLITTPSSVKYLKFAYKFNSKKECYENWINNIDSTFGIVKSDKEGNYGTWNRTTYQFLNSMPFTKDDIREIIAPEVEYVNNLKNDLAYFMNHVNIRDEYINLLDESIDELEEAEENDEEYNPKNEIYKTSELINNLLAVNSDFQYTDLFKSWRKDQIKAYTNELRKGKIRIKDTIYGTIFANPYEMLLHSIGEFNGECLGKGAEIYCPFYEENINIATFRNPHINGGNVMVSYNKYHEEYKWFNLTNNIIILNVSDNDFPDRGQGFDYDSDVLLLTNNDVIVRKAIECLKYPTPLNMVKGDSKKRYNTMAELAKLDYILSNNFIGKIINKSQIINSYMWDLEKNGADSKLVGRLYDISSMLSSLSQIELDKAKKSFDNISMSKELKKINNMEFEGDGIIKFTEDKKMIVPNFFKYVAQDNTYRDTRPFETPMDYLQELIDEISKPIRSKKKTLSDLFVKYKELGKQKNNPEQEKIIFNIIDKCNRKINSCMMPNCPLNEKGKNTVIRNAKRDAIELLSKLKIRPTTIFVIANKCFKTDKKDKEWSKMGMLTLNLLYQSHTLKVLSIFKNKNNSFDYLIKDKDGNIDIFGEKYFMLKSGEIMNQIQKTTL